MWVLCPSKDPQELSPILFNKPSELSKTIGPTFHSMGTFETIDHLVGACKKCPWISVSYQHLQMPEGMYKPRKYSDLEDLSIDTASPSAPESINLSLMQVPLCYFGSELIGHYSMIDTTMKNDISNRKNANLICPIFCKCIAEYVK